MKMLGDRLLIKRDPIKKASELIVLPDQFAGALEKVSDRGTLLSWGDQCRYKDDYKEGKRVMFSQYQFLKSDFNDDRIIIREADLHAFLEDE